MRLEPKRLIQRLRDAREATALNSSMTQKDGLRWSRLAPCPLPLYDAASAQIGSRVYVFGGYLSIGEVSEKILVLDLQTGSWAQVGNQPSNLAHSHAAAAGDGERYIYVASGQSGAQCSPAIPDVMSFDTKLGKWTALPPLPKPRYAGTMQLWRGRLHFVGGSKEDRWSPAADHWSLAVSNGVATETNWTALNAIPVAGMHRGSAIVGDEMFVLGGQQGDFIAVPGDPDCRCNGRTQETYLSACFKLSHHSDEWMRIADLPVPVSHTDFATLVHDGRIFLLGGQVYKDPEHFYIRLTDAIQAYDPSRDRWSIPGKMPYPVKFPVAGILGGKAVAIGGQRGKANSDRPGPVTRDVWATELSRAAPDAGRTSNRAFAGKKVLLLSHEISLSGAPLLLLETARILISSGAEVRVANLGKGSFEQSPITLTDIPLIPSETARFMADDADIVIANTVSPTMTSWVRAALSQRPELSRKLAFWVHEIDVDHFLPDGDVMKEARLTVFDSEACRQAWISKLGPLQRSVVIHPAVDSAMMTKQASPIHDFPLHAGIVNSETASLTRAEARARMGVADHEFLVLSIGTVEPRKGQVLLLKTLARKVHDTRLPMRLAILGFKNRRRRAGFLLRLSRSERRVLAPCRTYVRQNEIAGFYRAADAFVMNTQGMDGIGGECFGRVTIEAMAAGAVVLGTDAGGTREIIQDGRSGLLFPVGAAGQAVLADHLECLVRDPSLSARLSEGGQQRIEEHFTEARYLNEFAAAFDEAFGRHE